LCYLLQKETAFRPDFGCQTALLKIVEDWNRALDDNKYMAAISMV
jgi:hypothetical protein